MEGLPPPVPLVPAPVPWHRRPWGASLLALAAVVAFFVVGECCPGGLIAIGHAVARGGKVQPAALEDAILRWTPVIVATSAVVAVALWAVLRAVRWLAPSPEVACGPGRALRTAGWTVGLAVAALALQWVVSSLLSAVGMEVEEQEVIVRLIRSRDAAVLVSLVLVAPFGEEIVFRRVVHRTLVVGNGPWIGLLASSFVFAFVHLHLPAFANYFALGLCCALAYERTGSLGAAMFVHAANNAVACWATAAS